MPQQLILPLSRKPAFDAGSFLVASCNSQATDFIRRWPDWPAPAAALFGPRACGKTHLASIWQKNAQAIRIDPAELVFAVADPNIFLKPLLIEDLDQAAPDASREHALMELFDRPCAAMLLTGRNPPPQWPAATGDWASRLKSLVAFEMWSPDDEFLSALVRRHFAERQVQAPESVIRRILVCVERTPDAVSRFIDALDAKALTEKRPVSLRLVWEVVGNQDLAESANYSAAIRKQVVPL